MPAAVSRCSTGPVRRHDGNRWVWRKQQAHRWRRRDHARRARRRSAPADLRAGCRAGRHLRDQRRGRQRARPRGQAARTGPHARRARTARPEPGRSPRTSAWPWPPPRAPRSGWPTRCWAGWPSRCRAMTCSPRSSTGCRRPPRPRPATGRAGRWPRCPARGRHTGEVPSVTDGTAVRIRRCSSPPASHLPRSRAGCPIGPVCGLPQGKGQTAFRATTQPLASQPAGHCNRCCTTHVAQLADTNRQLTWRNT